MWWYGKQSRKCDLICPQNVMWWVEKPSLKVWSHFPTECDVVSRKPKSKSVISFAHRMWCGETENKVEKYDLICPQTVMWWVGKQSLKVWSHLPTGRDMVSRNPKSKSVISFAHRIWYGESENQVEKCDLIFPQNEMWWVGKQSRKCDLICPQNVMWWVE